MAKSISRYLADISSTTGVLDGTLSTAAQSNITSLGTLSSLTVSGSAAMTLTTAAQPNITSVGTLSSLTVSGNTNATLTTAAQPNITSVGTLTALTGGTGDLTWDTNTLFVDSSANKIGIGTLFTGGNANSVMVAPLNIKLTSGSSAAVATFNLEHLNSTANIEQRLQFNAGDDATADSYSNMGYIAFGKENDYVTDANRDSYLTFATSTNATQAERMRITSAGKVGLGQTAPKEVLNVAGAGVFEGDHATGVNAMNAGTGVLVHASGSVGYITATSSGSNHRDLQIRALNAGSANAGQITLSYTGDTTFTGASSTVRLGSHSYGTSLETTTSDGSDGSSVSLDAGSGAGSNARGAWFGCYGNEASGNGGNIVGQTGASGDYKLLGGGSAEELVRIDGTGMGVGHGKSTMRLIVGGENNSSTQYNMTSGNGEIGIYGKQAYSNCDAHMEIATSSDIGWAPIYINKFNWASGEDGRWIQFLMNASGDSGTISYDGTNFAVTNGSDYRLKENIVDYSGGLAKLEELKVRTFNKKEGVSKHITQQGFIAHEAATANIPGFIAGEKDAMKVDELGETVPDYQTVNKEALIPYLVSAIQELSAKVKELESK